MRVYISQPMCGKTKKEIEAKLVPICTVLERAGYAVTMGYMDGGAPDDANKALWSLGKSISILSECDALLYIGEWNGVSDVPQGCKVEMDCADYYGIPVYKGEAGLAKLCLLGLQGEMQCK